jgi:glutathione S-transferase
MLQRYFWPMACSLASRIALTEAGIEARYRAVDLWSKRIMDGGGDFWEIAPKGAVPVLVLENGSTLTENAAVLQYIADLRPERGLAPPASDPDRYQLQEWLSFVGTEIHKAFLFPTFWYTSEVAEAAAGNRIGKSLSVAADRLEKRSYLIGDAFTVADAYLTWALLLVGQGGVRVAAWPSLVRYSTGCSNDLT